MMFLPFNSNTTGVTCGAGTAKSGVRVARSLVFGAMFCRWLFVLSIFTIMSSVLLRFTPSDYPLCIFKIFSDALYLHN